MPRGGAGGRCGRGGKAGSAHLLYPPLQDKLRRRHADRDETNLLMACCLWHAQAPDEKLSLSRSMPTDSTPWECTPYRRFISRFGHHADASTFHKTYREASQYLTPLFYEQECSARSLPRILFTRLHRSFRIRAIFVLARSP